MSGRGDKFLSDFKKTATNSRSSRKRIKKQLREAFGDNCCWCGLKMDFVKYGNPSQITDRTATIEHHFAKQKGDNILYLRLSHRGCNK